MLLERFKISRVGPFSELEASLSTPAGEARRWVVFHGDGGTGKSTVAGCLAGTRPGRAVAQRPRDTDGASFVIAEWRLGVEQPERPHPLRVVSPNVAGTGNDDALRRREQSMFDRRAAQGAGFTFVEVPADRFFGASAWALSDPSRTLLRYDVRANSRGDVHKLDLSRPVKQVLAYAGIAAAVAQDRPGEVEGDPRRLRSALDDALQQVLSLVGVSFVGLNARTLEPTFALRSGARRTFDQLPTQAKHLVAMVALPVRALWASQPGVDPREAEGVVVLDDPEDGLPPRVQGELRGALRQALPSVQWLVFTASQEVAAATEVGDVYALRRLPGTEMVHVYRDELAVTH